MLQFNMIFIITIALTLRIRQFPVYFLIEDNYSILNIEYSFFIYLFEIIIKVLEIGDLMSSLLDIIGRL